MAAGFADGRKHLGTAKRAVKRIVIIVIIVSLVALAAASSLIYLRLGEKSATTIVGSATSEYSPHSISGVAQSNQSGWPTYGYDAARDRSVNGAKLRPPFRKLWTFHGRSLLEFPPVIGADRIFLSTFNGRLYALDAKSGRTDWTYSSGRCGWSSPALADGLLVATFIGSAECHSAFRDGEVVAFNAATGALRWLRRVGPTESSPLIVAGSVYVGDWKGNVWDISLRSGRERWSARLSGAVKGSLASDGERLFIGTYGGEMVALDRHTGGLLWRSGGHGAFYSSPAVAYGRVYVGSLDDGVYAFGAATGNLLWSRPTGGYVYASPAVWNHLVLVGSYDDHFYALDAATGLVRWSFAANGRISGAASVIDGLVYFSTFNQRTYAVGADNGALVTSWPDGKYSPAVTDFIHLYLVGLGRLYAFAPS